MYLHAYCLRELVAHRMKLDTVPECPGCFVHAGDSASSEGFEIAQVPGNNFN